LISYWMIFASARTALAAKVRAETTKGNADLTDHI
jgi:hypothetical protein